MLNLKNQKIQEIKDLLYSKRKDLLPKISCKLQVGDCTNLDTVILLDMYIFLFEEVNEEFNCVKDFTNVLNSISKVFSIKINLA